jgi:hypothetical protein
VGPGLIVEVSTHTPTNDTRQDSSGRVIGPSQKPLPDDTRYSQETDIHASHQKWNLQLLRECGTPTFQTARPPDSTSSDDRGHNSVVTALICRCYGNLKAQGLRNRKWSESVFLFYFGAACLDALFFISLTQVFRGSPNWSSGSYVLLCLNNSHVDKSQLSKLKWLILFNMYFVEYVTRKILVFLLTVTKTWNHSSKIT